MKAIFNQINNRKNRWKIQSWNKSSTTYTKKLNNPKIKHNYTEEETPDEKLTPKTSKDLSFTIKKQI